MTFRFHPEALREYSEAARYYAKISSSVAAAFVSEMEHAIHRIQAHPEAWTEIEADVRRYLLTRFPFGVFYTIEAGHIIMIQSVMHLSREPGYWRNRLFTHEP